MKKIALVITILMTVSMVATSVTRALDEADSERDALMALYNSADGPSWKNNSGWGTADPFCGWHGVTCEAGQVTVLSLPSNQLNGSIPAELGNLSHLQELHLSVNELNGSIPPELGNLSNLKILGLLQNDLSGPVPGRLGELNNLLALDLDNNQLDGPIPIELANLSNLIELTLFENTLSGLIPTELANLSLLENLFLGDNQLNGPIPADLSNLSSLRRLSLNNNPALSCWQTQAARIWAQNLSKYDGPDAVCSSEYNALMTLYNSTTGFDWTDNSGWGVGDPCDQVWYGASCESGQVTLLELPSNQLNGPIPAEVGDLSSLQGLDLSGNQLNDLIIPAGLSNLSNLTELNLSQNPDLFCWQTQSAFLWAQGLTSYAGPGTVCPFVCLPMVTSAGD